MRVPQSELNKSKEHIRGRQVLDESKGKAVRPHREDGYTNVLNKYGTTQDNSEAYTFEREQIVPDMQLTTLYEGNGLFSKIIDTPAEEALKHGFDLNLKNDELVNFTEEALDDLDWEEKATTAIKWARLYGGAVIVMLIDDGKGLEEPVDWENIRSIDELRVFERAVVQPDYTSLYMQDFGNDGKKNRTSHFGEPEFYYVNSMFGSFKVHESRCLVFKNGTLPEQVSNTTYQMWGMPEYIRIKRALRETTTAHTDAVKLLERSVQAIYSMKNLAQLLATDDGENQVLKRLEIIDMARGLLNSIAIDAEGENYDFKTFQFSGVKDVIESTCNMLSALTSIPQTLLFGRSPSGMDATGMSDLENYYNFVERIQKLMLKRNFRYLLDVIYRAGVASGELEEEPSYKLSFNPLWSMSETEQATVEQTRAATALTKAQTAQIYVDMQAIDPTEVRHKLASDEDFDVEDIVEEDDNDLYSSLFGNAESEAEAVQKNLEQAGAAGGTEQTAPAPSAESSPDDADEYAKDEAEPNTVGILVIKDGRVLTGVRKSDFCPFKICGAGGHIEEGETPEQAAVREAQEEFGITPKNITPIGIRTGLPEEYGVPMYFIATDYDGDVHCDDHSEMVAPQLSDLGEVLKAVQGGNDNLFLPFSDSFDMLNEVLYQEVDNPRIDVEFSQSVLPYRKKSAIIETSGVDDFNESDHPRDENGQFTEGGGGSGSGSEETANAPPAKKAPKPTKFSRNGDTIDVAKDTHIKIGSTQSRTVMVAGSITGVEDFAGVSGKKPVEKEPELLAQYPNSTKGSWKHSLGFGKVRRKDGTVQDAEIHWFESDDVGQVGWKVKRFGKGGKGQ